MYATALDHALAPEQLPPGEEVVVVVGAAVVLVVVEVGAGVVVDVVDVVVEVGVLPRKLQVTPWMRPMDWSASTENALGEKSRSSPVQAEHLSSILTITLFPLSAGGDVRTW